MPLDRIFENFFETQVANMIKHDTGKSLIELEVPGAKREDINLDYDNSRLRVTAKCRQRKVEEWFTVPDQRYDVDKISASLADGILTVEIPRRESAVTKRSIAIR